MIRADRRLEHRAHGQAEHDHDPRDREPRAGLLGLRLRIGRLVLRGVRHDYGRAVDDLDGPAMKMPRGFRAIMYVLAGLADEFPDDLLGEAVPGLAIAGRAGRDTRKLLVIAILLESVDGIVAGLVVGEDLREEDAEGGPRREDPIAPRVAAFTTRGLDEFRRQRIEEGKSLLPPELLLLGLELVANRRLGRLDHGDLLAMVAGDRFQPDRLPTREVTLQTHETSRLNF